MKSSHILVSFLVIVSSVSIYCAEDASTLKAPRARHSKKRTRPDAGTFDHGEAAAASAGAPREMIELNPGSEYGAWVPGVDTSTPGLWDSLTHISFLIAENDRIVQQRRRVIEECRAQVDAVATAETGLNIPNEKGQCPLEYAICDLRQVEVCLALLKAGANPNVTPRTLFRAIELKEPVLVDSLLHYGNSLIQKNKDGLAPLEVTELLLAVAQRSGNKKDTLALKTIKKLLLSETTSRSKSKKKSATAKESRFSRITTTLLSRLSKN